MWILRWIVIVLVVFFLVGFLTQNNVACPPVKIFGWTTPDWPLSYQLFLAGLAGYLISLIVAFINQIRLRGQISSLRKQNRALQTELDHLRNLALEEDEFATVVEDKSGDAKKS